MPSAQADTSSYVGACAAGVVTCLALQRMALIPQIQKPTELVKVDGRYIAIAALIRGAVGALGVSCWFAHEIHRAIGAHL